jgi:hypothetical protein
MRGIKDNIVKITRYSNATVIKGYNRRSIFKIKDDILHIEMWYVPEKDEIKKGEKLYKGKVRVTNSKLSRLGANMLLDGILTERERVSKIKKS